MLLSDLSDVLDIGLTKTVSPFDQLKVGQWIMLCGPHPNSSLTEPRFVMNWYQVLSVEGANNKIKCVWFGIVRYPRGRP